MLQTVSKCRSVFMSCVLFEHCFIIESHDRQFDINTYLLTLTKNSQQQTPTQQLVIVKQRDKYFYSSHAVQFLHHHVTQNLSENTTSR